MRIVLLLLQPANLLRQLAVLYAKLSYLAACAPRSTGHYGKIDPTKPMGPHGEHNWWYRRLAAAGIVAKGTTKGQRMHKARHTAGQRVLDATGNLKAVQQLLGHASIQTTGDIYTDWDIHQFAATMAEVLDDDSPTDSKPNPKLIPLNSRKPLQNRTIYRQRDSNPCLRSRSLTDEDELDIDLDAGRV